MQQHQVSNSTSYHRYPSQRDVAISLLSETARVLEFGCSEGRFLFDLHNRMPKKSSFWGYDLHTPSVEIGQRRFGHLKRIRLTADYKQIEKEAPFDAVFVMSVLCRWGETEHMTNSSAIYPFQKFDGLLSKIDTLVRPGGILCVYNSNYLFADASVYPKYEPITHPQLTESGYVTKFDRNGDRLYEVYPHSLFRKLKGSSASPTSASCDAATRCGV